MTIQEIRNLIAKKIAGQGTQVDVGGGLPTILNAICDAVDSLPGTIEISGDVFQDLSKAEAVEALGITEAELDGLFAGKYANAKFSIFGGIYSISSTSNNVYFIRGFSDGTADVVGYIALINNVYSFNKI